MAGSNVQGMFVQLRAANLLADPAHAHQSAIPITGREAPRGTTQELPLTKGMDAMTDGVALVESHCHLLRVQAALHRTNLVLE